MNVSSAEMYEVLDRSTVEEQAAMPGPSSSEKVTDGRSYSGLAAGQ